MKNYFDIIYDFDGTLTDFFYPIYGILNSVELDTLKVMKKYEYLVNDINGIVNVFMYGFVRVLKDNNIDPTKENICVGADSIRYSEGVEEYFKNINSDAKEQDIFLRHFVITSGIKEFVDKTKVAKYFERVYGSSYYYENGKVKWPNEVIESKNKVEKIYDINKKRGLKKNDCSNMIYIGDGLTDYDSMKFVKENGGISICVYGDDLNECMKLKEYNVINGSFKRDYTKNSELYKYIEEQIIKSKVGEK